MMQMNYKSDHSANLASYNKAQLYSEDPRFIPNATALHFNAGKC